MDKSFRTSTADGAVVEFGLVRHALLAKLAAGTLRYEDVCDAHPELLRAAKNIGRSTGETCPVCREAELVEVTYVFGARLPAGGTCPPRGQNSSSSSAARSRCSVTRSRCAWPVRSIIWFESGRRAGARLDARRFANNEKSANEPERSFHSFAKATSR